MKRDCEKECITNECYGPNLLLESLAAGLHVPHLDVDVVPEDLLQDVDGFDDEPTGLALRGLVYLRRLDLIVRLVAEDERGFLRRHPAQR